MGRVVVATGAGTVDVLKFAVVAVVRGKVANAAIGVVIVDPTVVASVAGARGVTLRRSWKKDWLQNN